MNGVKSLVEHITDAKVDIITLNDSDNGNVLNSTSLKLLIDALKSSIKNIDSRVILLRSNGKNFCLGMDLKFLQNMEKRSKDAEETISSYSEILYQIYTSSKPVISVVNGAVKAGGIGLMGACDIVIASDISTFELSEVYFGLIPANVLPFIYSLRLSPQKIRYLILTAKRLSAEDALKLNLIDEVFPEDDIEEGVKSIIKGLFRASPSAIAETKRFTAELLNKNMDKSLKLAKETLLKLISDPKVIAGIKAFQEGDIPEWFEKYKPDSPLVL